MPEDEKKELTPEEAVQKQMDLVAEACTNIMKVAERTGCPPEAVATVVLLRGLSSDLRFLADVLAASNQNLLQVLAGLFGEGRIKRVPSGSRLVH